LISRLVPSAPALVIFVSRKTSSSGCQRAIVSATVVISGTSMRARQS